MGTEAGARRSMKSPTVRIRFRMLEVPRAASLPTSRCSRRRACAAVPNSVPPTSPAAAERGRWKAVRKEFQILRVGVADGNRRLHGKVAPTGGLAKPTSSRDDGYAVRGQSSARRGASCNPRPGGASHARRRQCDAPGFGDDRFGGSRSHGGARARARRGYHRANQVTRRIFTRGITEA